MTIIAAIDHQDTGGVPDQEVGGVCGHDYLRRVVQALLALYLLPVLCVVLAVGGLLIAASAVGGLGLKVVRTMASVLTGRAPSRAGLSGGRTLRVVKTPLNQGRKVSGRATARHSGHHDPQGTDRSC